MRRMISLLAALLLATTALAQTTWTITQPTYTSVVSGHEFATLALCEQAVKSNVIPAGQTVSYPCHPNGDVIVTGSTPAAPPPPPPGTCAKSSTSKTMSGVYDAVTVDSTYIVRNDNYNGTPGQVTWYNDHNCWGATTTAKSEQSAIGSYPSATRGWSAAGMPSNAWTTQVGMGIPVTQLAKAKVHWAFNYPTSATRWLGLMDVYLFTSSNPDSGANIAVDLMVDQAMQDQVFNGTTYYATALAGDHGFTITLGGVTYDAYIDDSDETGFATQHTIHLFRRPDAWASNDANPTWGVQDGVTDLNAIIHYFMLSNPVDDSGAPIKRANGSVVTTPLIASSLYLDAVNAGPEIDFGSPFTTTAFCVAVQSEADCP